MIQQRQIPWSSPWISEREKAAVAQVLESGWLSMGNRVRDFESRLSSLLGARYGIAVSSGTTGLEMALQAAAVGRGDEVVVPALTYFATVSAVVRRGALPIFVDVDRATFNLDPTDLERRISKATRAVIYIDYGGIPADSARIMAVAKTVGAAVVHDAAQSIGSRRDGKYIGFNGDLSVTSFHAAKLITTIEGGMLFTNSMDTCETLRRLRNQGEDASRKYHHVEVGMNARMTDLQAAIGLVQLEKLEEIVRVRRGLARKYNELFANCPNIELFPELDAGCQRGWFFYPVLVDGRDLVAQKLRDKGIDTRIAYPLPVYRQDAIGCLDSARNAFCPNAEVLCSRVLNLPMFHGLNEDDQGRIADELRAAVL